LAGRARRNGGFIVSCSESAVNTGARLYRGIVLHGNQFRALQMRHYFLKIDFLDSGIIDMDKTTRIMLK
jgi:hypothetical protein